MDLLLEDKMKDKGPEGTHPKRHIPLLSLLLWHKLWPLNASSLVTGQAVSKATKVLMNIIKAQYARVLCQHNG